MAKAFKAKISSPNGDFTVGFDNAADLTKFEKVYSFLQGNGFQLSGYSANEALYVAGAWRKHENVLFSISDGQPFDDGVNGITHPDPFNVPTTWDAVWVTAYVKPTYEDDWVLGEAPDHERCEVVMDVILPDPRAAVDYCDKLLKLIK